MFGRARDAEEVSGVFKDICLARAADPELARGRPGRRSRLGDARVRARARHDRRRARLVPRGRRHDVEGDPGHRAQPRRRDRVGREPLHVLGQHARVHGSREGRRAHRARRHVVPVVDPAGDEAAQGGQGRAPALAQHRPAVLEDVRRRDLRRAVRGEVRPEEGRHQEDEHQGRVPDLDAQRRRTTRSR